MMKNLVFLGMLSVVFSLAGCGGGSGSGGVIAAAPLPQKNAVMAFSVVSTSRLPFRINTFKISAYVPAGVTVPTVANDPDQISASALAPGSAVRSALQTNYSIFGRYSAPVRKVTITVADATAQTGFGPGDIVLLNCNIQSGMTLTASDFTSLNGNLSSSLEAFGFDPSNGGSTVNLSGSLKPDLNVYFAH